MRKFLLSLVVLFSISSLWAQDEDAKLIDWKFLSKVEFKDKYYPEYEAWYLYPEFPEEIKAVDGKRVVIKGYVIPLDVESGLYALSAYPFSSCFFCGGAGPESVMSLKFKTDPPRYETDDVVTFTGILNLNNSNVDDFNYVLKQAEEVE